MVFAAPSVATAETLYDAIALAYQTNPTLRAQRAELRAVDEGYVQARAGLGPNVSVSGQATYQGARVDQESLFGGKTTGNNLALTGNADLSVVQPLYSGGQTATRVDAAAADVFSGRQTLRQAEGDILQQVVVSYVDVRRDQQIVKILSEEIGALEGQLAEARAKDAVRQATRTDVAQAEARWLSARAQMLIAQGRLNASRAEYLAVVGQNPAELAPQPDLAGVPTSVDEAFEAGEHNNPGLQAAIRAEAASRARVAQAKAALRGTLALRIDVGAAPVVPYDNRNYDRSATAAIVFNQPLFTSGLMSSQVREAIERDNHDLLGIEVARRATVQSIAQAWEQLTSTRAALAVEDKQIEAQQAAFEGNRVEERVGLRTTIDVLNAEQELENAEVTLTQGRHDEYVARATLLNAMGVLEAQLFVPNTPVYHPEASFRRVVKLDAAPWEGAIEAIDRLGAPSRAPPKIEPADSGGERPQDRTPLPPAPHDDRGQSSAGASVISSDRPDSQ
jgi:outer membrane protein